MLTVRHEQPVVCRVQTEERRIEIAEICDLYGWYYIIDVDRAQPENIDDLEQALYGAMAAARTG